MTLAEFFFMILAWIIGSIISAVILGYMSKHFIIEKIFENEEIQEFIMLFREGKDYLKQVLENQKRKD